MILLTSDVITKDKKKTMISDSYVLWKISDPLKFAQTLNSSVESGEVELILLCIMLPKMRSAVCHRIR